MFEFTGTELIFYRTVWCSRSPTATVHVLAVPLHSCRTVLKQTAKISVFGIPLLGDILERLLFSNYGSTVSQVREDNTYTCNLLIIRIHCKLPADSSLVIGTSPKARKCDMVLSFFLSCRQG